MRRNRRNINIVGMLALSVWMGVGCNASGGTESTSVSTDSGPFDHTDTTSDSTRDSSARIDSDSDSDTISADSDHTDDGVCTPPCNAFTPDVPVVGEELSTGSVTTYGSVTTPEFSVGGACNYSATQIQYYAAIHVNIEAGDDLGPWNGGQACGGCLQVRTKTETGWAETFVRVTDRCADEFCGVDLGGAPAAEVMPLGPGRYEGEWTWQPCEGHPEVFDGPTAIWVKDGSNAFWSLIQVRNPLSRVIDISYRKEADTSFTPLPWATEAENFYSVPPEILQDDTPYIFRVSYDSADTQDVTISGSALAAAETTIEL
ncbi:MAG: hypothetical protein JXX29_19615 [Deltaproteobacteria bacterium]|nr:hypothetical protein [Deltaproteobacteria bacterium]MBN2673898.1 hypothetical protein [Deltaproteobacteria bacterium]